MMIDEAAARRSLENYSFSDYKPGSATAEYNAEVERVAGKIEEAKNRVGEEGKERLDRLFESFKVKYADWINRSNHNGAGHVSVMISGPANYNMRAHEKYMKREGKLWEEYEEFENIDSRIHAIIVGDKIIKSNDENAIEKLQEKLQKAQEEHQGYKDYNIKARAEGREPFAAYVMANSNGRIKGIKDRIAYLERIAEKAKETPAEERTQELNGVKIVDNLEMQRLQIFFPGKPEAEVREALKRNGFRWAPSVSAWQSYRSESAMRKAKEIVGGL